MRGLSYLRYTSADSGPIGYKTRVGLIAMLPLVPFIFFLDPQSLSPVQQGMFWAAVTWAVLVFAFGIRELFASVWKKNG